MMKFMENLELLGNWRRHPK